jgi:O-antigen/teichoic acid export membrane protein
MKSQAIAFLKWSEQYTKTDMVYLIGQSGWLLIGQLVIFLSSFILAYIFGNYIEPSDYGLYKFVLAIATIATLTTLTGISTALAKSIAEGHSVSLYQIFKIRILFGLIGTIALLAISIYYILVENLLLATMFAVASIWIPVYESISDYQFFLQGQKNFKAQAYLRIIQRLILTSTLIITILISNNIVIITIAFFSVSTLSHLIGFYYTVKKYPPKDHNKASYTKIIKYGKSLSLMNILLIGANQLDKIILFKLLGPAQLAIYFFAIAIPQEISGLLGNINNVAFPKLVNKKTIEFKIALIKKILLLTTSLLIPVILFFLIAPYLFQIFFPKYLDSILISQLYIGTILFIPISLIWNYFYAMNHQKALWFGSVCGPIILILSILVFVPYLGLLGAVIAVYIKNISDMLLGLYFFFSRKEV